MKMEDLIVGLAEGRDDRLVALKGPRGFRMDSDPTHTREDWEDVWTQDIARAHVFNDAKMRKFLKGFAYNDIRRDVRSIPVRIVDGVPQLLPAEKKSGFFK